MDDLTKARVAKENKEAAKSVFNKLGFTGRHAYELAKLMQQLEVKKPCK